MRITPYEFLFQALNIQNDNDTGYEPIAFDGYLLLFQRFENRIVIEDWVKGIHYLSATLIDRQNGIMIAYFEEVDYAIDIYDIGSELYPQVEKYQMENMAYLQRKQEEDGN